MYKERQLVKIIKEICLENNYKLQTYSDEWVLEIIDNRGASCLIMGYKFPNNNASISKICDDKCALSSVLVGKGISCVKHVYLEKPSSPMYDGVNVYDVLQDFINKYKSVVCKINSGSGGNYVYCANNYTELKQYADRIFAKSRAIAVSPKIDIQNEYRVIVENGEVKLMYNKMRPTVVGDGVHTISELCANMKISDNNKIAQLDYLRVPKINEIVTVSWKHNLAQGSKPDIDLPIEIKAKLKDIALHTAKVLDINFASIDIVVDDNNNYMVLEINSGVMMEKFSRESCENYIIAKSIYSDAIKHYFNKL